MTSPDFVKNSVQRAIKKSIKAFRQRLQAITHRDLELQDWVDTFATLSLNFGKGAGHSTYIAQYASANDVIIVETLNQRNTMHRSTVDAVTVLTIAECLNFAEQSESKRVWLGDSVTVPDPFRRFTQTYNVIWVDCAYLPASTLTMLYSMFIRDFSQYVICLGVKS
jgi:hypothetical protein